MIASIPAILLSVAAAVFKSAEVALNTIVSAPVPPSTVSAPTKPMMVSLPEPATILSAPAPPVIESLPEPVVMAKPSV